MKQGVPKMKFLGKSSPKKIGGLIAFKNIFFEQAPPKNDIFGNTCDPNPGVFLCLSLIIKSLLHYF